MIITPVAHGLDAVIATSDGPRSTGLHVSDLYSSLYKSLDPKRYDHATPPNPYHLALGLAWEQYLEKKLLQAGVHATRPPECSVSIKGTLLYYSPDLFIENGVYRLGEIKLTSMSVSEDLSEPKFDKWLTQAKLYCHLLDVPRMRFYVLFTAGDYKGNRGPMFRVYDLEFSPQELEENWLMILHHAEHLGVL